MKTILRLLKMPCLLLAFMLYSSAFYGQSAGFNATYIVLSINNGSNAYYDLNAATGNPDFNGANLGTYCQGATTGIVFKGAEHNVYKCGGCDITSTRLMFRVYPSGSPSGSFVSNTIGFTSDFANGCGGRDQQWSSTAYATNILSGLGAGNYTVEVYSEETTSCSGTVFASNGGLNYKANFTVNANVTYYADTDGDGYGDVTSTQISCTGAPTNYVANSTDCSVNDSSRYQSAVLFIDVDADGYNNGSQTICYGATVPTGYSLTTNGSDCNDGDATKQSSYSFYADADGDGYTSGGPVAVCAVNASTPPAGYSITSIGSDCDDNDNTKNDSFTFYADNDADGYGAGSPTSQCAVNAGAAPVGYSVNNTDCDDTDGTKYQSGSLFVDADDDGYDNGTQVVCYGAVPVGYSTTTEGSDCNDADALKHTSYSFYVDNDNDGFGAGNPGPVCAAHETAAPAGYSNFGTDCDDTRASTYPGASEIGYDGRDNDCDGQIDEGYTPKVTVVQPGQCGTVLAEIDSYIYANLVSGAQGYNWRVTTMSGPSIGQVQFKSTVLRNLRITQLGTYLFNTAYKVEVSVQYGGFPQPYTASDCTVTTPEPKSLLSNCGQTISAMSDVIYANLVRFAGGYRFRITNGLNTFIIDRQLREFRMSLVPNAQYNTAYNVEVAVRNLDGTYLGFGNVCAVTTPNFPTTQIQASQCGTAVPTMTTAIYADAVTGAQAYRFQLTSTTSAYSQQVDRVLRTFSLSNFTGLQAGATYVVTVSVKINDVFGPFGPECTLIVPGAARFAEETAVTAEEIKVVAYPNPFTSSFKLNINTAREGRAEVKIYDAIGRLVDSRQFDTSELDAQEIGSGYPSGVYTVIFNQSAIIKTLRMIKR